jgi:hypothetical protein
VWIYEETNPLPPTAKACEATSLFPTIISKNEEIIIRDNQSKKVLVTVYHNRLGPEAIQIMQSTIKEMLEK